MSAIDYLADRQATWSATANTLKATVDRARIASFVLSIGGAIAAALATQFIEYRTALALAGAVALATAAFLITRFLTREALSRHLRARAASEALKREAFLYSTGTGPYANSNTKDAHLSAEQEKIEDEIDNLSRFEKKPSGLGNCPRSTLTVSEYTTKRVDGQIRYYTEWAHKYGNWSEVLHAAEWILALAAAILTAVAGVVGKGKFDWASITAVLTTIGGAVLAHLQASRLDDLIASYRATARRLQHAKQNLPTTATVSEVAQVCEDIISAENKSWFAMWSK